MKFSHQKKLYLIHYLGPIAAFFIVLIGLGSDASAATTEAPLCFVTLEELKADARLQDTDLLARLVLAEGISSRVHEVPQCRPVWKDVYAAIAWGVRSRVALGRYGAGMRGVIFRPGQFRPAVSPRSPYATYFLCPSKSPEWGEVLDLVTQVLRSAPESNPFLQDSKASRTEKKKSISRVSQFYYPFSRQATAVPPRWAQFDQNRVNALVVNSHAIPDACIWFFRN